MRSLYSGIFYDERPLEALRVRSAIGREYSIGSGKEVEAFEALPIPHVPVDEALKLSLKLYRGEEAIVFTPAPYEFRKPLVEKARYFILDGRRVNRNESSRIKYLPSYIRRRFTAFIGVPEKLIRPLLLSGVDAVIGEKAYFLPKLSHSEARKRFVEVVEEEPIALRFLRLLRRSIGFYPDEIKGSLTALERPEVARRRERIESYEPPEGDALVLLPCSARKPYSLSKTHKPIVEATKRYFVHHLIITSPLLLVPRELETLAPALFYDHPPTGKRTECEKLLIADLLERLLKRYEERGYKSVIAFLPEDYREAIEDIEYPIEIYKGRRLEVSRLKRKLEELGVRKRPRDRENMARNALRALYNVEPPAEAKRFVDRIALNGDTFGVRKEGSLKPRKPMLERLYKHGIYIRAPSERLEDVVEAQGDAYSGLYVPRERKQLRSVRLSLSMRQIRKLMSSGVKGIYSLRAFFRYDDTRAG